LAKRFEDREDGLRTAIGALFADNPKTALIVVDQFEEILTHLTGTPDSVGRSGARAERLIANLVDAAENSERSDSCADYASRGLRTPMP
jgi:hypothetical protein